MSGWLFFFFSNYWDLYRCTFWCTLKSIFFLSYRSRESSQKAAQTWGGSRALCAFILKGFSLHRQSINLRWVERHRNKRRFEKLPRQSVEMQWHDQSIQAAWFCVWRFWQLSLMLQIGSPLLLLQLIGQLQLLLLRSRQHSFELLQCALVLVDVLQTGSGDVCRISVSY